MRLREEQAHLFRSCLERDIGRAVHQRREAKDLGDDPALAIYNRELVTLRAMGEELDRLMHEMGWTGDSRIDLRIVVGDIDVTDHVRFNVIKL